MKPTKDRTKLAAVWLPADVMRDKHHKRECTYSRVIHYDDGSAEVDESCICDRLQACEQRSYTLGIEVGKHDGWVAGHAAGVLAAREAVAGADPYWKVETSDGESVFVMQVSAVLAAIEALGGER